MSANPTGPLTAAERPPRRLRRLTLPRARASPATRSSASTTSTTTARRSSCSGESIAARMTGERRARGRLRGRLRGRAGRAAARARASTRRPRRARAPWARADDGAGAGDARALPRALRPLLLRALAARGRQRRARRSRSSSGASHVYESEGATWLRTTAFGDDKDRVLRRSVGRADLLRLGHRVPRGQARARLRPADQRAGRRPPRLRRRG